MFVNGWEGYSVVLMLFLWMSFGIGLWDGLFKEGVGVVFDVKLVVFVGVLLFLVVFLWKNCVRVIVEEVLYR